RYYIQPVSGMTATQASATIGANGISSIYGTTDMNADTVVGFTYPSINDTLYSTGIVVLYPDGVTDEEMLKTNVPNLIGKSAMECIEALRDANLNCSIEGEITGICNAQSIEVGTNINAGTIVTVTLVPTADYSGTPTSESVDFGGGEDGISPSDTPASEPSDENSETTIPTMGCQRDIILTAERIEIKNS
ncbi:MAG TPA: PASTA domain-containing protein, partial [Saccharofermentans sp.]|nr:PASTA domain-containing protein [Saccharofermentans sp.]